MKKIKINKKIIITAILLVLSISAIIVYAYKVSEDAVSNPITYGYVESEITEEFSVPDKVLPESVITKRVAVKNTGSMPCYVRIKLLIEPIGGIDSNGNIQNGYFKSYYNNVAGFNTQDWKYVNGYYYYKSPLQPGATTECLIDTIKMTEKYEECTVIDGLSELLGSTYYPNMKINVLHETMAAMDFNDPVDAFLTELITGEN